MGRIAATLAILTLIQSAQADFTKWHCFVSGAMSLSEYTYSDSLSLNGEYTPANKWCNNRLVWGKYVSTEQDVFELNWVNTTNPKTNMTVERWAITRGSGCQSNRIYAKMAGYRYYSSEYTMSPGVRSVWYQFDPNLYTTFTNYQMKVVCKTVLSTEEKIAILVGSICGFVLLVVLLVCLCRKCRRCRKNKQLQAASQLHADSPTESNQLTVDVEMLDPGCDGESTNKPEDNEAPPGYNIAYVDDEKSTALSLSSGSSNVNLNE